VLHQRCALTSEEKSGIHGRGVASVRVANRRIRMAVYKTRPTMAITTQRNRDDIFKAL
jgi:hypothetical protein